MKIMRAVRIYPGINLNANSDYHFELTTNTNMNRVDFAYTNALSQPECYTRLNSNDWELTANQINYKVIFSDGLGPNYIGGSGYLNFGINLGTGNKHEWSQTFHTTLDGRMIRLDLEVTWLINGGLHNEVSLKIATGKIPGQGDILYDKSGLSITQIGWIGLSI